MTSPELLLSKKVPEHLHTFGHRPRRWKEAGEEAWSRPQASAAFLLIKVWGRESSTGAKATSPPLGQCTGLAPDVLQIHLPDPWALTSVLPMPQMRTLLLSFDFGK